MSKKALMQGGQHGREGKPLPLRPEKTGQKQADINHCALRGIPSAIVTEQSSGKRPVAGGNIKTFDSYKQQFL